jgi:hypothetical protein
VFLKSDLHGLVISNAPLGGRRIEDFVEILLYSSVNPCKCRTELRYRSRSYAWALRTSDRPIPICASLLGFRTFAIVGHPPPATYSIRRRDFTLTSELQPTINLRTLAAFRLFSANIVTARCARRGGAAREFVHTPNSLPNLRGTRIAPLPRWNWDVPHPNSLPGWALDLILMTTLTQFLFAIAAVLVGFASMLRQGLRVVHLFRKMCCTTTRMPSRVN